MACLVLVLIATSVARAQTDGGKPLVMRADDVTYDQQKKRVIAIGNVEMSEGERILFADRIVYDQNTDTVTAKGNVSLLEPTGEVLFASEMELRDKFREGFIRDIRIRFGGETRLAANGAVRSGGNRTEMSKAVFSACKVGSGEHAWPPLWQIKAFDVVHDQRRKQIEYRDAFMEVMGIPIAYTPYFSHPDPTVKRKSGFLAPSYGSSSNIGFNVTVPYYLNLAPDRDITFAPIFTADEGVVMAGEYRQRTEKGQFGFSGSITRPEARDDNGNPIDGRQTRGHIFGSGRFTIDDTWQWGFDLARSTDGTYLRRYDFSSLDTLTSRLFTEGFDDRDYLAVNAYTFQGLAADDSQGETPIILPAVDYSLVGEPDRLGGHMTVDANFLSLSRTEGTDSRRLSLTGAWQLPYLGPAGDIYTLTASLRGDGYLVNGVTDPARPTAPRENGLTGRVIPQIALDWRYPWMRGGEGLRQIIEPVVSLAFSPNDGRVKDIPNEDSQDFEFNDTNLFSPNRFPGLDRVEGGLRVNYGLRLGVYGADGGRVTGFIGQSYRKRADNTFAANSGLDGNLSDVVGRLSVSPASWLDLSYRFRVDRENFTIRRNEVNASGGPSWLRFFVSYLSLDDPPADLADVGRREEISLLLASNFTRNWSASAFTRQDLTGDGAINAGFSTTFQNECVLFQTVVDRRFTVDRDVADDLVIKFVLQLKHLG